jgi:hypothetical protein
MATADTPVLTLAAAAAAGPQRVQLSDAVLSLLWQAPSATAPSPAALNSGAGGTVEALLRLDASPAGCFAADSPLIIFAHYLYSLINCIRCCGSTIHP